MIRLALVTEYYPLGSLLELSQNITLTLEQKKICSYQIAKGTEFLHDRNMLLRTLGLKNVMVKKENDELHIVLTDFGLTQNRALSSANNYGLSKTILLKAPETFKQDECSVASDVWTFAVTILQLYCGENLPSGNVEEIWAKGFPQHPDIEEREWIVLTLCWNHCPQIRY